ncbi:Maf family protein [Thiolapillus brandeum]|uniref:dTTP/UTP pyrophosphatase n=1 Tax=Thiolapillus brandeum TaxID=1076588 RepID=A0A7U6JHE4_9GAMM|nr:Maf family protein [Thiolapillus brandeum]BAO43135.1 septum formation protein Maf [Thiolapillus brandeum]
MIILASQSPRRSELLTQIGVEHSISPVDIDETPQPNEPAESFVQRITWEKASVGRALHPGETVLAADTCIVRNDRILGKPRHEEHAVEMLLDLSGRSHEVLSGVALFSPQDEHYRLSRSQVSFRTISEAEARRYWATGEPADKAGGYAIQGRGALFIEHMAGSYSGVMGLPLFETGELLAEAGLLKV